MRSWDDHWILADRLRTTKCKWILSSYNVPEVHNLYKGFNITPVQSFSGMRVKKNSSERVLNKEVLITNFEPPDKKDESSEPAQIKLGL
jgi:hypothetical protein